MKKSSRLNAGIVGCGAISNAYFGGCKIFDVLKIVACADIDVDRAKAKAAEHGIPIGCSVDELLANPDVDLVINLTVPLAHAPVNQLAIANGKHAYCEKPYGVNRNEGQETLRQASASGLRTGCAPDTFLGGGIQTCINVIDSGAIGTPLSAVAFWIGGGHEGWHPSPRFYYLKGGGPLFDMGPYYLTALVALLGGIKRVAASAKTSLPVRTITAPGYTGEDKIIHVEVPTHYSGTLDFHSGVIGTMLMSFDVFGGSNLPRIEIYGTEGTLSVPDPNGFGGEIKMHRRGEKDWKVVAHTHSVEVGRGIGVADMAKGILTNRPHRASGDLAYHVLDVMEAFEDSSSSGKYAEIQSKCERPAPLPLGLALGELD